MDQNKNITDTNVCELKDPYTGLGSSSNTSRKQKKRKTSTITVAQAKKSNPTLPDVPDHLKKNPARNFFGTCFKTENEMMTDELWNSLKETVKYIVYQREICPKTEREHFQWFINFHKPQRVTGLWTAFPMLVGEHIEHAKDPLHCINYCKKDDTRKENHIPTEYGKYVAEGERSDWEEIRDDVIVNRLHMQTVSRKWPEQFIKYHKGIERMAELNPPPFKHKFPKESFTRPFETDFSKAIFVWGHSGCGKTPWACHHFKNPLRILDFDALRKINPEIDGLVFDELSYKHLPDHTIINLLDMDHDSEIHCRYSNGIIPAGMPRIFVHNNEDIWLPDNASEQRRIAIDRRMKSVNITEKTFGITKSIDIEISEEIDNQVCNATECNAVAGNTSPATAVTEPIKLSRIQTKTIPPALDLTDQVKKLFLERIQ